LLQPDLEGFRATVRDKVLYRLIDEPAALTGPDNPVNALDRPLGQHDVNAFAHRYAV
jgi:hypothetical protein